MENRRPIVQAGLILVIINAALWFIFGFIIAINAHPSLPDLPFIKPILVILSFMITGFLTASYYFLGKHNRSAYFLTLAFFGFTTIATIFDDFGWVDLIFLLINLIPFVLLLIDRKWYLHETLQGEGVN